MYEEYLRAHQIAVVEVSTTDAALGQLPYVDAVITGLMVRGTLDVFELIRRVRIEWGSKPILVVTACAYSDKMQNAHRAGADVVLLKPCLPDMLLQELKRTLDATKLRLVSVRDRRSGRDRRAVWRGGRRVTDWLAPQWRRALPEQ
jgi:DNA-binding response OmpR family regulator